MTLDICTNLDHQNHITSVDQNNESIVKDKSNFYPSRSKNKELEINISFIDITNRYYIMLIQHDAL